MKIFDVLTDVETELRNATRKFGSFASAHEGYAVIKEEVDELWDEVKGNKDPEAIHRMKKEALQVAAMALRFIIDINPENQGKERKDG